MFLPLEHIIHRQIQSPIGVDHARPGGTDDNSGPLDPAKPLDGHSVNEGINNNHLKTLQGELSNVILTFSSINDTLKGLEHTVQKHDSVITDLGELSSGTNIALH